jgi:hypothetical protein
LTTVAARRTPKIFAESLMKRSGCKSSPAFLRLCIFVCTGYAAD